MKISQVSAGPAKEIWPTWRGFRVTATTHKGEVFILKRYDLSLAQCKRLVERIRSIGKINEDYWSFWRTEYGSEAYEEEVAEVGFILGGGGREDDLPDRLRELA